MRQSKHLLFPFIILFLIGIGQSSPAFAETNSLPTQGNVQFDASLQPSEIVDPEKPIHTVDPGPTPSTEGYLRIDFVPKLNFGRNKVSEKEQSYPAHAQLFHGETKARGNFVQVTDSRATGDGWKLQVRQESMFTSNAGNSIKGAYISLDKIWANSLLDKEYAPSLQTDVIKLDKIGMTYDLATAEKNKGYGTWSIEFGASEENDVGLSSTLKPVIDKSGVAVVDPDFENKQVYENNAVNFFMPRSTDVKPGNYQTVITWLLAELP